MRHLWNKQLGNERGATFALVAVSLVVLLGAAAIAIDLGMLYDARNEAQRAADAGALAGASAYTANLVPGRIPEEAVARARDYARRNPVHGLVVPAEDIGVELDFAAGVIRVSVTRRAIPLWFARAFGQNQSDVAAMAVSQIVESGTADCIKPLLIPDWWVDANNSNTFNAGEYYDPLVTGYGMPYRDPPPIEGPGYQKVKAEGNFWKDFGRPIVLKTGSPGSAMQPGWFFPMRLPDGGSGGAVYRDRLSAACPDATLSIGDLVHSEPGNMIGPTKQGITDAIDADLGAHWVNGVGVQGSKWGGGTGEGSPRMVTVPLFAPNQTIPNGASGTFEITNFGTFFVEKMQGNDIHGRWTKVQPVPDNCRAKGNCRPYMQTLRLIQ